MALHSALETHPALDRPGGLLLVVGDPKQALIQQGPR